MNLRRLAALRPPVHFDLARSDQLLPLPAALGDAGELEQIA
jgi:hypothetical protein